MYKVGMQKLEQKTNKQKTRTTTNPYSNRKA